LQANDTPTLRLILGDQLNSEHSWFRQVDPNVTYLMMECRSETDYTTHHIQKVMAFFGAMRAFADQLQQQGHHLLYYRLDDPANAQDFETKIRSLIEAEGFQRFEYLLPDEYRLDERLARLGEDVSVPVKAYDTEHFLTDRYDVQSFFKGKKTYLMESFYRSMRKKWDVLMTADNQPVGERWNFDIDNRNRYDGEVSLPEPPPISHDLSAIKQMIQEQGVSTMGWVDDPTAMAIPLTREEALQHYRHFLQEALPAFGTYQDAMLQDEGKLFHSLISFGLNVKLINPHEVITEAASYWEEHQERIDLAQVEGFIRQILGWREFMRGIYWAEMPGYQELNHFNHQRPLPHYYWTAQTHMNCLAQTLGQSLSTAYAHHIQRLMVAGNFALLAGIHPDEVDHWYLGVYWDAVEWVEITNTRGMSQYADGGKLATKPYVSSASYMKKMSNYCDNCYYDPKKKTGERACPFNSLFWHFMERNRSLLQGNHRMGMMYKTLDKMSNKQAILDQAETYLGQLEQL